MSSPVRHLILFTLALAQTVLIPCALASEPTATSQDGTAFFEQKIRPLLVEHCYSCHSAEAKKLKGGLLLDSREGWQRGGDSNQPALVAGDVAASMLIRSVRYADEHLQMPPKKKLSDSAIADLTRWVEMGAPDPRVGATAEAKRADKSWWSLQPLTNPSPPSPAGLPEPWSKNPVDQFIFHSLSAKGLAPSPPASPRDLIRRVTYDVTGLSPTPEEVAAFLADAEREPEFAYEKLIDRLLAAPQYGEHWGRHWLDVIRFGESTGYERNLVIDNAWPFRDYVIRSLNEDKAFNQFITEHLAGDVIGKDNPEVEIGCAFLVAGPYDNVSNQDAAAKAQIRADTLDDVITAASTSFLGVTMNCARCHNHKFDPITQEDYFRMRAAFEGVNHGSRVIATQADRNRYSAAVQPVKDRLKALTAEQETLEQQIIKQNATTAQSDLAPPPPPEFTEERFAPVDAKMVRLRILATNRDPKSGTGARIDEFEIWSAESSPRNVALASNGGVASGAAARGAEDAVGTYEAQLVNDGKFMLRWFAGDPADLTITLPAAVRIDRVSFSNMRDVTTEKAGKSLGPSVADYEVLVSTDGRAWTKVADSLHRKPLSDAHVVERRRRMSSLEQKSQLERISQDIAAATQAQQQVPPLQSVWAGEFTQPKVETFIHIGGDPQKRGPVVVPSGLSVLDQVLEPYTLPAREEEGQRRLALAQWITNGRNPLTARVLANRVWQYHFGTGIVDTPSDFGYLGGKPSHPELLDWLAGRLQHHGWKLKPLHREILLSQTYRQSSAYRKDASMVDKDARLFWRFPPRRLSSEEIRDTLLQASGSLDLRRGGPGFRLYRYMEDNVATYIPLEKPGPETWRRSVYHQNARASVVDVLSDFDAPDVASATPRRSSTTTPMQALAMLNHAFVIDMADAFAKRLQAEAGSDPAAQITRAFALAWQRTPSAAEIEGAVKLVQQEGLPAFCRALLNANETIYLD